MDMKQCLESDDMPPVGVAAMGGACEFCMYAKARTELTLQALQAKPKHRAAAKRTSLKS
jgi:hypothetical protein